MREEGLSQTGAGWGGPPCACAHVCVYARRGSLGLQGVRGVRGGLARVQEGTRSCGSEGRRWWKRLRIRFPLPHPGCPALGTHCILPVLSFPTDKRWVLVVPQ